MTVASAAGNGAAITVVETPSAEATLATSAATSGSRGSAATTDTNSRP